LVTILGEAKEEQFPLEWSKSIFKEQKGI